MYSEETGRPGEPGPVVHPCVPLSGGGGVTTEAKAMGRPMQLLKTAPRSTSTPTVEMTVRAALAVLVIIHPTKRTIPTVERKVLREKRAPPGGGVAMPDRWLEAWSPSH